MSYFGTKEFYLEVAKGKVDGHEIVHKFGAGDITTTLAPVTQTNAYQTPTTVQALEFVSSDANDTSAGTGAREITITGLNSAWEEVTQTVATNGTTAVALGTNLIRMYRWYVSSSGTYASSTAGSHVGTLTIQGSGGGTVWDTIPASPFPAGQSQIGAYTVPLGKTGFLLGKVLFTDTSKVADVYFFKREGANDVTVPYNAMRVVEREVGLTGGFDHHFTVPKKGMPEATDMGFMAKVSSGTAEVSVEFELLLVDNDLL